MTSKTGGLSDSALAPRDPGSLGGADLDPKAVISVRDLWKVYRSGESDEVQVLRGVTMDVAEGEAVAIVGPSGAGKSTLLQIAGGLDTPTRGAAAVGGWRLGGLDELALAELRNREIGFVFQFHHLLREFTALENVMMPQLIAGKDAGIARDRARELLKAVGLEARLEHEPRQLSGGEQQRVAVARALANGPSVLLADEPTGNLDSKNSEQLHDILFRLRAEQGLAMVLVTHSQELARRADRILLLTDGVLEAGAGFDSAVGEWSTVKRVTDDV